MKTGLTKKQKVTELYYNAKDPMAEIYTHDTKLKRRLLEYAEKYPQLCQLTEDDEQGGLRFEIAKERIIIRLSHGQIVEQGNHQELLHKKGRYYDLYTLQYNKQQIQNR